MNDTSRFLVEPCVDSLLLIVPESIEGDLGKRDLFPIGNMVNVAISKTGIETAFGIMERICPCTG